MDHFTRINHQGGKKLYGLLFVLSRTNPNQNINPLTDQHKVVPRCDNTGVSIMIRFNLFLFVTALSVSISPQKKRLKNLVHFWYQLPSTSPAKLGHMFLICFSLKYFRTSIFEVCSYICEKNLYI